MDFRDSFKVFSIIRHKVGVPVDETRFVHNGLTRRIDPWHLNERAVFFFCKAQVDFAFCVFQTGALGKDTGPRPGPGTMPLARTRSPGVGNWMRAL